MLALSFALVHGFHVAPSMLHTTRVPRALVSSAMKLDEAALTAVFHSVDTDHSVRLQNNPSFE